MTERVLPPGLYETPITAELDRKLSPIDGALKHIAPLDSASSPRALARLVQERMTHALAALRPKEGPNEGNAADADPLARQLALTNQVLTLLQSVEGSGTHDDHHLAAPARHLSAIKTPAIALGAPTAPLRPELPLSTSDLMVNGHRDVNLGGEVKRELASADRVDLLLSFLKWSGLRLVEDELRDLVRRRPGSLRVLTTAYMSATERKALDALVELGAQVRVSYDTTRTRLHAKAWLFHRESGFSTGCIGSSNLFLR